MRDYEEIRRAAAQRVFELVTARLHHDADLELAVLDRITLLPLDEQHHIIAALGNLAASCFTALQEARGNDVLTAWQTYSARIAEATS